MNPTFRERLRQERAREVRLQTLRVLADNGYGGFRVDEVARRVGVAKGTIYLDFPGKDQLIHEALETAARDLVSEVSEAAAGAQGGREQVLRTIEAAARLLVERPERGILAECRTAQGLSGGTLFPCTPLREHLESVLREAKTRGELSEADAEATSEALLGLLSRPTWRQLVVDEGIEEALRRSGFADVLTPTSA